MALFSAGYLAIFFIAWNNFGLIDAWIEHLIVALCIVTPMILYETLILKNSFKSLWLSYVIFLFMLILSCLYIWLL